MPHYTDFIRVFIVCQSMHYFVTSLQRVNALLLTDSEWHGQKINLSAYDHLVLMVYLQRHNLIRHSQLSCGNKGLHLCLSLCMHLYIVCANIDIEGSG